MSVPYTSDRLTISSMSYRPWRRMATLAAAGISGRVSRNTAVRRAPRPDRPA
ncbi:hypothetical protein [Microbispora sp. NPDC049633]|uniref:hypothetical protein n=1 Tax=Microbispora sp. NPDC049633 TaxID=3154355 RepID=UPI003433BC55